MCAAIFSSGFRNLLGHGHNQGAEYQYLLPHHLRTHAQTGAEKRDAHFHDVKKRNQERARLAADISATALDPVAHKQLVSKAHKWRMIELAAVISSLIGLIIAVLDYELCMYYDGYAGIRTLPDHKIFGDGRISIPEHVIKAAIQKREDVPFTKTLRWANFVSCWITIALLAWRNTAKTRWTNQEYSKEIWLEERGREPSQFYQVDDPNEFNEKDIDPDGKMTKEERFEVQMKRMIVENVPRKAFFTKKFVLECISQMIFPYPFYNTIIFMP